MRAVTSQTQKYRYVSSMTYELPFGKGKKWMSSSRLWTRVRRLQLLLELQRLGAHTGESRLRRAALHLTL
jgi:hypothetical protein